MKIRILNNPNPNIFTAAKQCFNEFELFSSDALMLIKRLTKVRYIERRRPLTCGIFSTPNCSSSGVLLKPKSSPLWKCMEVLKNWKFWHFLIHFIPFWKDTLICSKTPIVLSLKCVEISHHFKFQKKGNPNAKNSLNILDIRNRYISRNHHSEASNSTPGKTENFSSFNNFFRKTRRPLNTGIFSALMKIAERW